MERGREEEGKRGDTMGVKEAREVAREVLEEKDIQAELKEGKDKQVVEGGVDRRKVFGGL